VITSKEVFAARKRGEIDKAYEMAIELIKQNSTDAWNLKAYAWCLIDLIKREAKTGQSHNLTPYRKKLEEIRVDPWDKILSSQKEYALKLCNPYGKLIFEAKELSKAGKRKEAAEIYRQVIESGNDSQEARTGLAWELYYLAKLLINQDAPDFETAKHYIHKYLMLKVEKPSRLHSCILRLANDLAKNDKLKMGSFAREWNLEHLESDDYESVEKDGKAIPSLAEQVLQKAGKDAILRDAKEELKYVLPFINKYLERYPGKDWLKLTRVHMLHALGKGEEAFSIGIKVLKEQRSSYHAWELLGDISKGMESGKALGCYCKALLCSDDIHFVGKVKIKLAELLAASEDYARAKFEVEEIANYRKSHNQKVSENARLLQSQSWYETTSPVESNHQFYLQHAPNAEALLLRDLPWISGLLGETFFTKSNPDLTMRKVFIKSSPFPLEVVFPESKFTIDSPVPGTPIKVKGEFDKRERFQIYALECRTTSDKWDIFQEFIGIVDHVNTNKEVIHFVVDRRVDGLIRFSELEDTFNEGSAIALRLARSETKDGIRYQALKAERTDKPVPKSLLVPFDGIVREGNGMGFTREGIFIPGPHMKKHRINDGDRVAGLAILNYNKKRSEWGFKAIKIDHVTQAY